MRSVRITALAIVTTVIGISCGSPSGGGGGNALQTITAAAVSTNQAGTAKVTMEMTVEAAGQALNITADGAMDLEAQLAHMTMSMSSDDPAMGMPAMSGIEMVTDGFKVYTKYPPEMAASIPGGKPWSMIDMQAVSESQGMDLGAMSQTTGSDPTQMLQYLNGVAGDVETVGEDEVRGVKATHYRATIDFDKIADQAPADLREAVRLTVDALQEQVGETSMPIEVWIGTDGLVRRMTMTMETDEGPQGPFKMDMTMEFYDFGAVVNVEIPDPSQVYDMTEMMSGMGGGIAP